VIKALLSNGDDGLPTCETLVLLIAPEVLPDVLPDVFPDVFPDVLPDVLPLVFPSDAIVVP
jgi:hypothetical protein